MCVALLLCCMLVGLDWAEPMMHLYFHVTCSCIFMHTYLQFFIFWYIVLLVIFWFSLSLLLALVCSMAPKRKSTPYQNPLCFGASSSSPSNPTPSHVRFRDEKAKSDFLENFSWWGIYSERQVIVADFSNIDLLTVIYSRGWKSLCGIPVTWPSVVMQEFYSNMHGIDTSAPHFFSRVWGTRIAVTPEIVFKVLHVPR